MCVVEKRGAENKGEKPCRDFQEGVEVRLEGTQVNVGERMCR